eukprot:TRINITY_DN15021_c0_g1_i1.p1 TRINITY_DN15021_c0_g1~~TRINITY_DN15021_c0_g1_i1.p1  ORF type:complete len:158 (-),score=27.44 TRINITY_DN15021_c0_g1_i1:8-481(-)
MTTTRDTATCLNSLGHLSCTTWVEVFSMSPCGFLPSQLTTEEIQRMKYHLQSSLMKANDEVLGVVHNRGDSNRNFHGLTCFNGLLDGDANMKVNETEDTQVRPNSKYDRESLPPLSSPIHHYSTPPPPPPPRSRKRPRPSSVTLPTNTQLGSRDLES